MQRASLVLGTVAALITTGMTGASADPGEDGHGHGATHAGAPELPPAPPSVAGMPLVGNADKDGVTNSDLAFYGNWAFAGNYDGFRIIDISSPEQPTVLSDYFCRGPQNDVSVAKLGKRLFLFQSVDRAQTKASCDGTREGSSSDTPLVEEDGRDYAGFGFEGIRVFDVTNPRRPEYVTAVPTACGSHTHTLVPDQGGRRVLLYVSSYPLGSGVTAPSQVAQAGGLTCASPHQKISIVEVTDRAPQRAHLLREEPLSSDSRTYAGAQEGNPQAGAFIACHDITVFMATRTALGACAGDAQIWDISDPENPSASDGERHTHIRQPAAGGTRGSAQTPEARTDQWEFVHNATATYDGRFMAFADETGGGGTAECDGPAEERGGESENGFYYFYPMVRPGAPAPPLLSRYMIPRPQGEEICVSHNGNIVPTDEGYYLVTAYYQGGDSVVDFTDVLNPREVAHADRSDEIGQSDSWSTYWYNDLAYTNGGLNRREIEGREGTADPEPTRNRGLDIAEVFLRDGTQLTGAHLPYLNPQTIEQFSRFERLAGADRFGTAAAIARETFTSSDTVLLANGLDRHLPDALAGNYLAGFEKAPVLLTTNDQLPAVTQAAIDALGAKRIIVLGGTNAISKAQADRLAQRYQVERIGGVNRYETAALIATRPPASYVAGKTAIVARGDVLADALVAGPIAYRAQYPILLTAPNGLNAHAQAALQQLAIEQVLVAGGTAAVSEGVVEAIGDARGNNTVATTRLAGADRQGTAVAFARFATGELGFSRLHVDLARGDVMADALAGGPHAASVHGVILLTRGANELGSVTRDYLAQESITLERGHVLGGTAAVSAQVVAEATDAANSNDPLATTPPRS